jgi:hypothetical protein
LTLTLLLILILILIENAGFSPAFIYERARLRALSSKKEFKEFDFNNLTLKSTTRKKPNGPDSSGRHRPSGVDHNAVVIWADVAGGPGPGRDNRDIPSRDPDTRGHADVYP